MWNVILVPPGLDIELPGVHRAVTLQRANSVIDEVKQDKTYLGSLHDIQNTSKLTPWLMEPVASMPHSQRLSNNPYPEPNQPNFSY